MFLIDQRSTLEYNKANQSALRYGDCSTVSLSVTAEIFPCPWRFLSDKTRSLIWEAVTDDIKPEVSVAELYGVCLPALNQRCSRGLIPSTEAMIIEYLATSQNSRADTTPSGPVVT